MIQTRAKAALTGVHITPGTATVARAKLSFHANECRCIYNSRLKDNSRMTARERPQLIAFSANLHAAAGNTMQHASAIYNNNDGPP